MIIKLHYGPFTMKAILVVLAGFGALVATDKISDYIADKIGYGENYTHEELEDMRETAIRMHEERSSQEH